MVPCVFQLSELKEFGSLLCEQDKNRFIERFSTYMKLLLRVKNVESYASSSILFGNTDVLQIAATASFMSNPKNDWVLLKEMMIYSPNFRLEKEMKKHLAFLQNCENRMEKLCEKGFWNFLFHHKKYKIVKKHYNRVNKDMRFQDLFSAATGYFVSQGWGKGSTFKMMLS